MVIAENAELHRAQRTFRRVLDAFARPGTVQMLEPASANPARPAALDPALEEAVRLFVDQAVRFCVVDVESDAVAAYLTSETHAQRSTLVMAGFVVVPRRADAATEREAVAGASLVRYARIPREGCHRDHRLRARGSDRGGGRRR